VQLQTLKQWYDSAPGNWLLQFESEQVNKWLPLVRGATVLQIGGLPDSFSIAQHTNQDYIFLSNEPTDIQTGQVNLLSDYEELPFRLNSLNLVLLVHVLEYCEHPAALLKDVYDALAPNGKLLLFCFNPWSAWGLHKRFSHQTGYPWSGKFISPTRLQQWLSSIGYSHVKDKTLCFRFPLIKRPLTQFSFFLETLGQIAIPMLGAVNVFFVEKRVYGSLKEERLRWKKERQMNGGMIEPTTRIKIK
jgi:SAM-dependent methyltransferase